jgi:hypothetical protein
VEAGVKLGLEGHAVGGPGVGSIRFGQAREGNPDPARLSQEGQ